MENHKVFRFQTLDELKKEIEKEGVRIDLTTDLSPLKQPVEIGPQTSSNSMAVLPMEGCDCNLDGSPSELTKRRYLRYARGGSGLIWWEANAVVEEGKSNPHALIITKENVNSFRKLVHETKKAAKEENGVSLINILQLTHSGRYSRPADVPAPMVAFRDPLLDPRSGVVRDNQVVSDDYLDSLTGKFVEAALLAKEAGFDGVDIKAVHKYLVSELLGGFTRKGKYGGESLENRSRFLIQTVKAVRQAVGKDFIVACRLNVFDAHPYPYGFGCDRKDMWKWDSTEPVALIKMLVSSGVDLLALSSSNPYYIYPQFGRPFDIPSLGVPAPKESQLSIIEKMFEFTRVAQKAAGSVPVVGNGYSWLRQFIPNAGAANLKSHSCSMVGLGRSSFAYPDAPYDIFNKGAMDPRKVCVTCSKCTQIMRDHGSTGCVVRDAKVYLPIYREARAAAQAKTANKQR
ncbi:MAG TPA: NADH:flavin oxidoreductase [Ruminococcaceae bacterium]|nr:NADH:flavin oxidoreductase [Oscillospiraceae bacterium]